MSNTEGLTAYINRWINNARHENELILDYLVRNYNYVTNSNEALNRIVENHAKIEAWEQVLKALIR